MAKEPSGLAEFVKWTWRMINDGHEEIQWGADGSTITVTNPERLSTTVLPQYFRHSQYASWVRALNAYDFKKSGVNQWSHPNFVRGCEELLPLIRRKPPPSRVRAQQSLSTDGKGRAASSSSESPAAAQSTSLVAKAPNHLASSSSSAPPGSAPSAIAVVLQEAKQQLWWLQNEEQHLARELDQVEEDNFQQRFDAVRIMQAYLAKVLPLGAAATVPLAAAPQPEIIFNPSVLPVPPGAATTPGTGTVASINGVAAAGTDLQARPGPGAACGAKLVLEQSPPPGGPVDAAAGERPMGPAAGGGSQPTAPGLQRDASLDSLNNLLPSVFGGSEADIDSLSDIGLGQSIGSPAVPSVSRHVSDDLMRLLPDTSSPEGLPHLSSDTTLAWQGPVALSPIVNPVAPPSRPLTAPAEPIGDSLLRFAGVLARLPRLPDSTAQLPARGTLQREKLEQAIQWCFAQIQLL